MWEWAVKKAEHWRTDAFEWWCCEDSWESLGHKGDQASQSWRKSTLNIHWKDWCCSWSSNILKSQLTGKDPAAGQVWEQEGKKGDRGGDGWMVSWSQWTWVWQTPGDSEGQGSLTCCSPWGCKETWLSGWLKNNNKMGFPGGAVGKESTCQCCRCKKHRLDPQVGKVPCRREWQPTPAFLPGLVGYSPQGHRVRHNWAYAVS